MATVNEAIVTPALQNIGVLGASETAAGEDAAIGLLTLNRLIDGYALDPLLAFYRTRTTWDITANDGSYTVGSGADVNIARPVWVHKIGFIDTATDPDTEYPLRKLTEQEYEEIPQKALTSTYPQAAYWNPTYANATLTLWPVPTSSTLDGVIYHSVANPEFSLITSTVSLPNGYTDMLVWNLALALCAPFVRQPSPLVVKFAAESMARVKRANFRPQEMKFEAGALIGNSGVYNIRTDR